MAVPQQNGPLQPSASTATVSAGGSSCTCTPTFTSPIHLSALHCSTAHCTARASSSCDAGAIATVALLLPSTAMVTASSTPAPVRDHSTSMRASASTMLRAHARGCDAAASGRTLWSHNREGGVHMDDKGAVLTTWLPSQCNSNGGTGHFSIALNANMGIRIEVRDIPALSAVACQCCEVCVCSVNVC